jgi:hypothetical protein
MGVNGGESIKMQQITEQSAVMVNLKDFDEDPGPYCMSFGFDLKPLIRSIEESSLINAPLITRDSGGKIDVVAGYRRIMALKSLQRKKVPCKDLSDSGLSTLQLLLLNLYDNLATREFNEVEQGMILKRLIPHLSRKKIVEHCLPLLNLPSHEPTLDSFLNLEKMEPHIKASLAAKRISFQTVKTLMEVDPDSRSAMFGWISKIRLNSNQQTQFIEYARDISIKEEKKVTELLGEKSFSSIMENGELNNPQKAKGVLDLLRSRRFPFLSRSEKVFQRKVSSLPLPEGVKVHHPPYFEGPDYRLEILFKEGKELKEKVDSLSGLSDLENIGDPWQDE